MAIDFNKFGKSQLGGTTSVPPVSDTTETTPSKGKINFNKFGKSGTYTSKTPVSDPNKEGMLMGMAKGLVSAPATLLARPIQAAESIYDVATKGLAVPEPDLTVAGIEAPKNIGDIKKDVGRAAQTIALGIGEAPLAAGALFGGGSSLEQGNDLASMETLTSTLVGMGMGKALDLVGKPLINTAGKVIGTITPKTLKEVANKGAGAVEDFMAQHELLGGIAKPLSEKITSKAKSFDTGVNKLFTGAKDVATGAAKSQYPTAKEDVAKFYEKTEMDKLMKPTKESGASFNKAKEVAKQAEDRGINLTKVAANNKIYPSDHIVEGKYSTAEVADALTDDAISGGATVFRPALREAQTGVQSVPISEIRQRIASRIGNIKDSVLSPEQKLAFAKKVAKEYADNSVTASRYRNGYNLENLYDSKLQTSSSLYKTPKGGGLQSISDTLTSQQKKIESDVFKELLIEKSPKELGIEAYFKAQEEKFVLANYLKTLNGKNAPQTLFQRGVRRASQLGGATLGAQTAGPFGMFSGYQFGGMMADTFSNASNPVKISFLKSIGKTTPEIYGIMKQYVTEAELARMIRPLLPPASPIDIELQKVKNAWGAIEMAARPSAPLNAGDKMANDFTQNMRVVGNTKLLPAGAPPMITPNLQGTPNPRIGDFYGKGGDVGGLSQRIRPKK